MNKFRYVNIKTVIFILLLISIFGYTYFQMRNIVTGPVITISTPQDGAILTSSQTEISGTTKNISSISLNDRKIFIDESGVFKEKLLLSPGYNIITLKAKDKFGRKVKKTLELIYSN